MGRSFSKLTRGQQSAISTTILCDLLKLTVALSIFTVIFFSPGERMATDPVETQGRVYASADCGSGGWQQGGGTDEHTIYCLTSHSESPRIYAGLWGDGVYVTPSGANSWSPTSLMGPLEIAALAIDSASPGSIVYAGTMGNGIRRSDNAGSIWMPTTGLEGKDVWSVALSSTADPIYGYAGAEGGIYISLDGTNWNLAGGAEIGAEKFYALIVDPQDSRTAYVGTKGKGVHRTTDGGIGWTPSGLDGETVRALTFHPDDSAIIYAGTQSHGVFKSADGGNSWPVNGLVGHDVMAVAVNPRNPELIYAGTYGDGVWISYNGGHNWNKISGLTAQVYSLTLFTPAEDNDCQVLYAGTTDGVWTRSVTSLYTLYLPLVHKGYTW